MSRVQAPLLTPCGNHPQSLEKSAGGALLKEGPTEVPGSKGGSNLVPALSPPVAVAPPAVAPSPGAQTPRAVLLAALFEGARGAVLAGDLDAARIAHTAIGKLLGAAEPLAELVASGAPVVDLAEERRRRER